MKAWQRAATTIVGPSELILTEVDEPQAGPGEVLLDVKAAGVCHTDVGYLDGTVSEVLATSPITLGHEVAGVVTALGDGVDHVEIGDRVAVLCRIDSPGTGRAGGFQARITAQAELLSVVPDNVGWDQAAVSTDAGVTAYNAVVNRGGAVAGERVGIIGLGGLGVLGAQAAVHLGAEVYAAEINAALHGLGRDAGAKEVFADVADFQGLDLSLIVDFAGFGTTTTAAINAIADRGRVVQVGLAVPEASINLWALVGKQVDYRGSLVGSLEDNQTVLELMSRGTMRSYTKLIGFDEVGDAIAKVGRGQATEGRFVVMYD